MRTIVSKFGGSSTADAAGIRRVLDIVRASPARACVVLSAPGANKAHEDKVTALLERCWEARNDAAELRVQLGRVAARFSEIAAGLGLGDPREEVLREVARAVSISRDDALSRGEYLCAALFSRFSGIPMVDAADCVAFDAAGMLDERETAERLRAAALRHGRFVMPGFYGAGPDGAIRVFPRNGSDISGALAAAGLEAGLYENWTDVPGLMTADPVVVPAARLIPQVGYRQMRALARAGARVLHPACLDPVAMADIPTRLRCTWTPESFGTLVDDACFQIAPCVAGRTSLPGAEGFGEISVFGIPVSVVRAEAEAMGAEVVGSGRMSVRVRVRSERYAESVRLLHAALIEEIDARPTAGSR